jgi:hypothetical protein
MFDFIGIGTVTEDPVVRDDGIYVKIVCQPAGDGPWPARVATGSAGPSYGQHLPYEKDDTVLWCCPSGDPGDGLYVFGRFFEQAEPPPQQIKDNPTDEVWVAKKGRKLLLFTGGADLRLVNQLDTGKAEVALEADGTIAAVPAAGKNLLLGQDTDGADLDYLCKKTVYTALLAFANTASTATTAAQIAVAAGTLLTALTPLPGIPPLVTTIAKGA